MAKFNSKLLNAVGTALACTICFVLLQGNTMAADKKADLVYVNWAEGIAYTNLAKVILEEEMDYEVKITAADVGAAYAAVASGDKDAFMETWLPVLHKDYLEEYEADLHDLGHVYKGTQSGLVVPEYVKIDKISELNAHADKFDEKITGIDAGAGVMATTKEVIEDYDLDLKMVSSSGPAMTTALKNAIEQKEYIVVTGWKPHWMFGRWDLKFLKQDDDKIKWNKGNIHIMAREDLEDDDPVLTQFLKNMFFTDKQLASLMLAIRKAGNNADIGEVCAEWMEEHEELVNSWIPEDAD